MCVYVCTLIIEEELVNYRRGGGTDMGGVELERGRSKNDVSAS